LLYDLAARYSINFGSFAETMIVTIKSILQHDTAVDSDVTVRGWLRSRRSSKGGFSFLHIHDGSCFGTVQGRRG
jgi:aspartyl/asparaginyl-tRNA synthetase